MRFIELSVKISEDTPAYPGDPKPSIEQTGTVERNGWNTKRFTFNSHFATHIDAPYHMLQEGKKLDQFPLETFAGEGIVLDANDPDLRSVREGDIVFFCTKNAEENEFYEDRLAIPMQAAKELVKKKVKLVGFDSPSPDFPPFELHRLFFTAGIPIVENLVHLDKIIGKRCRLFALPLRIKDSDGAPCRAAAMVD